MFKRPFDFRLKRSAIEVIGFLLIWICIGGLITLPFLLPLLIHQPTNIIAAMSLMAKINTVQAVALGGALLWCKGAIKEPKFIALLLLVGALSYYAGGIGFIVACSISALTPRGGRADA